MEYGQELILDLHDCDPATFSRDSIGRYFTTLCDIIGMEACDVHFWDDEGVPKDKCQVNPKTKGISAVQFILTSNITIHALDLLRSVYVNLFSCKAFDSDAAARFTAEWFHGEIVKRTEVERI